MTDEDEDFRVLNDWLTGEIYSVPPADRMKYTHAWTMSLEYLAYCRDKLSTYWQPPSRLGAEAYLYGYKVEADDKYDVPRLVRK